MKIYMFICVILLISLTSCAARIAQNTDIGISPAKSGSKISNNDNATTINENGINNYYEQVLAENVVISANYKKPLINEFVVANINDVDWSQHEINNIENLPRGFMSKLSFNSINSFVLSINNEYLESSLQYMSVNDAYLLVKDKLDKIGVSDFNIVASFAIDESKLNEIYTSTIEEYDQLQDNDLREGFDYTLPKQKINFEEGWYRLFLSLKHDGLPIYNRQIMQFDAIPTGPNQGYGTVAPVISAIVSKNGIESLELSNGISIGATVDRYDKIITVEEAIKVLSDKHNNLINMDKIVYKYISLEYIIKPVSFEERDLKENNRILTPAWVFEGIKGEKQNETYTVTIIDALTGEDMGISESDGFFNGGL